MTTTTSEPQRSGPGTPPVVGMVVEWVRYASGRPRIGNRMRRTMQEPFFADFGSVVYYCSTRCRDEVEGDAAKPKPLTLADFDKVAAMRDAAKAKAPTVPPCPRCPKCGDGVATPQTMCVRCAEVTAPQPAPWKCAFTDECVGGTGAPMYNGPHMDAHGACVLCADALIAKRMRERDRGRAEALAERYPRPLTNVMLPGSAHALAVAGARTWRRDDCRLRVPLDLPGMED